MVAHVARRLLISIPVIWIVLTLVFVGFRLVPGDAAEQIVASQVTQERIASGHETVGGAELKRLRHQFGLDQPITTQYLIFLQHAVRLDFGRSISDHQPVFSDIGERLPYTISLALCSLFLASVLGVAAGILAAVFRRSALCTGIVAIVVLGISLPPFFTAPMLAVIFGVKLGWLPVAFSGTADLKHLLLPSMTIAIGLCAVLTRYVRTSMIDALAQDFVRTARAKGVSQSRVVLKHALRNALIPVVTIGGLMLGGLLNGAIIVETIFGWPGLGQLTLQAIDARNYPLIEGLTLFFAVIFVGANLLVDIVYSLVDPRIQYR